MGLNHAGCVSYICMDKGCVIGKSNRFCGLKVCHGLCFFLWGGGHDLPRTTFVADHAGIWGQGRQSFGGRRLNTAGDAVGTGWNLNRPVALGSHALSIGTRAQGLICIIAINLTLDPISAFGDARAIWFAKLARWDISGRGGADLGCNRNVPQGPDFTGCCVRLQPRHWHARFVIGGQGQTARKG